MKSRRLKAIMCILAFSVAASAYAGGSGTSGAVILKQSSSPRAEGMGGAHTAVSNDAPGAAGWNPAGLYNAYRQNIDAVYFRGLVDDAFGSVAYSQTVGDSLSLGVNLLYYDAGMFDLTTMSGDSRQVAAERDILGQVTGAYKLGVLDRDLLVGLNVKALYSTLVEEKSALALAADAGVLYNLEEVHKNLFVGLAVKNFGTPIKYDATADSLPMTALLGAAFKILKGKTHDLLVAADGAYTLEGKILGNLGAEYWYDETIALRAGYKLGYDLDSFTLGFGLRYLGFQLDYGFGFMAAMNSVHKAGLGYTFGLDEKRKKYVEDKPKPKPKPKPTPAPKPAAAPAAPTPAPTPLPAIMAEVLEIEKLGGEVKNVILSVGQNKGLRKGYRGSILNASGLAIAKIEIAEVYPNRSLARVLEKSGEINSSSKVEIQKEK